MGDMLSESPMTHVSQVYGPWPTYLLFQIPYNMMDEDVWLILLVTLAVQWALFVTLKSAGGCPSWSIKVSIAAQKFATSLYGL